MDLCDKYLVDSIDIYPPTNDQLQYTKFLKRKGILPNHLSKKFNKKVYDLDSKYLKLDEPDMNKTSNYYKDKLNDKIMLRYNKNFSKANTSHLDYLSDICRVNLVIYDMAKNKQKYVLQIKYIIVNCLKRE